MKKIIIVSILLLTGCSYQFDSYDSQTATFKWIKNVDDCRKKDMCIKNELE